jgi:7-cyano-7-deazaguanine synthase in queuosine biosynthesis
MSGGIDSTIATLKQISNGDFSRIQPIFVDYGQKAREQEWKAVNNVFGELATIVDKKNAVFCSPKRLNIYCSNNVESSIFQWSRSKLFTGKSEHSPYVENRNMILISIAVSFAESQINDFEQGIIITSFRNEWEDTQKQFVDLLNQILTFLFNKKRKSIRIEAPLISYGVNGKKRMIQDFRQYSYLLRLTWSCYTPDNDNPCQQCEACRARTKALEEDN